MSVKIVERVVLTGWKTKYVGDKSYTEIGVVSVNADFNVKAATIVMEPKKFFESDLPDAFNYRRVVKLTLEIEE